MNGQTMSTPEPTAGVSLPRGDATQLDAVISDAMFLLHCYRQTAYPNDVERVAWVNEVRARFLTAQKALAQRDAAFEAMREALIDTMEQVEYATLRLNSAIKADARVPGNAPFVANTTKARVALALADQTMPQKETL